MAGVVVAGMGGAGQAGHEGGRLGEGGTMAVGEGDAVVGTSYRNLLSTYYPKTQFSGR